MVGIGKRKDTKKPNGWIPLGINFAIRQLFYFLFPCWFTPKGNWNKNIKRVGTFLINIFRIIMFIGAGILLFNVIARPDNAFLFMTLGVLLVMGGGVMILRQNKGKE